MRQIMVSFCLALMAICVGCGGPTGPVGPQSQVNGTVTNNGKPVTLNSQIVFFNAENGLTLSGSLDSLGKYALTPADPKLGVPAGRYAVSILPPPTQIVEANQGSKDYAKMMQAGGATVAPPAADASAPDIPEKFRDAKTSKLVFEVKEGPNTFDLDLSKL
jgi:hypothetical protein